MPKIKKGKRPDFGSIDSLPSGRYRARYRVNGILKTLGTYDDWETANVELQKQAARFLLEQDKKPTAKSRNDLRALVEQYYRLPAKKLAEKTRTENRRFLENHVLPTLGHVPLNQIDRWKVEAWWHSPALAAKPVTRRNSYYALRAVMAYGVKRGWIAENPCQVEGASAVAAKERPAMTVAQFDAITAKASPKAALVFGFMLGSHARLGEVVALTVGDIDTSTGTVSITKQITKDGAEPTPTKSKGNRAVKVLPSSFEPVKQMLAARVGDTKDSPLFRREDGTPINRVYLRYHWTKAAKAAGLSEFHIHDIRHVGLALVEGTGLGIKNVQLRAGHSTTAAALRYQHARLELDAGMADAADAALRKARGQKSKKGKKAEKRKN